MEVGFQLLRQSRERCAVMCHVKFCSDGGGGELVDCFLGSRCEVRSLSTAIQVGQAIQVRGRRGITAFYGRFTSPYKGLAGIHQCLPSLEHSSLSGNEVGVGFRSKVVKTGIVANIKA